MPKENEAKVLVIGNGFDIAHFLPTKYGDFIEFVKILREYVGDSTKVSFEDIFREKTEGQSGFDVLWLSSVRKYYRTEDMEFDLSEMQGMLSNAWLDCFKPIHEIETWIDFESEINNALASVAAFVRKSDDEVFSGNSFRFLSPVPRGGEGEIFFQRDKLIKLASLKLLYARNRMSSTIVSPEAASYFEVISKFNKNNDAHGISGISVAKIVDYLFEQLELFSNLFSLYLTKVIEIFSKNILKDKLNSFEKFHEIFSFNYTKTVNYFYDNGASVFHLHGDASSEDGKNIVLGVNEVDTGSLGISALSFTKYFQTLFKETDSEFLDDDASPTQLYDGVDYFVWGHSLDKSDEKYIKRLFHEISFIAAEARSIAFNVGQDNFTRNKYFPKSTITVYYHNQASKARLLKNLLDIIGKEVIEHSIRTRHLTLLPSPFVWSDEV